MIMIVLLLILLIPCYLFSQNFLSNLHATKNDPIYTTYAAAIERSEFIIDQGYQFVWYMQNKGVNFETDKSGNLCLAFKINNEIKYKLEQFNSEPFIIASYSDMVKYYYYPFEKIKCEGFFLVYSSRMAIHEIKITNESSQQIELIIYPYIINEKDSFYKTTFINHENAFTFKHEKKPDDWTIQHNVPYQKDLLNVFTVNLQPQSYGIYPSLDSFLLNAINEKLNEIDSTEIAKLLSFQLSITLPPNSSKTFRIVRGIAEWGYNLNKIIQKCKELFTLNLDNFLINNENIYSKIPKLKFENKDYEYLYWSAFNLMRQCMLPPEGKCSFNYYVFSREPTWGWGHAGQVFHESLTMLAYVFMDPIGAMNSQRVYIERQWDNGYINYRTGPYLDETIPYNNQYTTSAPWFSWENWEIYKITKDKNFLLQAYEAGKKFYNFWLQNRDSDKDSLCEWGGHAVLESVRDGYVAVWDQVGWPSNFEALDLNCMLVMEAKSLANMARELGYEDEYNFWINEAEIKSKLINKYMWDEKTGFYYHIHKIDHDFGYKSPDDLKRKEIIGFLPLWAQVASPDQAKRLIDHLTNPAEFWRPYGIPTLSAADKYYNPHGYWNGPVWVQWQYLIFRGLINYGFLDVAKELAKKVLSNVIYNLKSNHWFWELYSPDDNRAGWNKTYIWAGITARFLIDLYQIETKAINEEENQKNQDIQLNQNYPNPFNNITRIDFRVKNHSSLYLKVYDLTGRELITIFKGDCPPGQYSVYLRSNNLSTGTYLYSLIKPPDIIITRKMLIIK